MSSKTSRKYNKSSYARRAPRRRSYSRSGSKSYGSKSYRPRPRARSRPTSSVPNSIGGTIGSYLGHGVQQVVKMLTGFGDYHVNDNSLLKGTIGGNPPVVQNTNNNSFIVHHREYIGDVFAATSFTTKTYPINPGIYTSFPWLSQVADSFEQYKFRGLVFEYKSMSSDAVLSASASSALGTVIMSTQYNVLDPIFADKRTMENYEFANSDKPSCSFMHPIECKMSQTSVAELYVRGGPVSTGDLRLYDLGNFTIAVQGMQNASPNQVIGELWLSFEVELYKPKLLPGGGTIFTDVFTFGGVNVLSNALPFGPTAGTFVPDSHNNLGCTFKIALEAPYGANSIVFPLGITDGMYEIVYYVTGSTAGAAPQYLNTGTTVNVDVVSTAVKPFPGVTSAVQAPQSGLAAATMYMVTQVIEILQTAPQYAPGYQVQLSGGALPAGTQNATITITQINSRV